MASKPNPFKGEKAAEKMDKAFDKKAGIKIGSKVDQKVDRVVAKAAKGKQLSTGKLNPADQNPGNKQTYPKGR